MNPYAAYLRGDDPVEVMKATPGDLQRLLRRVPTEQMEQPMAPGKWSLREILAHLADCELTWGFRIRQALESPGAMLTAFDQDAWAARYSAYRAESALATFLAIRAWNLALLTTVTEQEMSNPVTHPERGTFPFRELLESIAGHDRNHLERLEELLPIRS